MPLTLSELRAHSARAVADWDLPVAFAYRPHLITAAALDRLLNIAAGGTARRPHRTLARLIAAWDITDNGLPLPVTPANMRRLPRAVRAALALAIYRDVADAGKASTDLGRWLFHAGQMGEMPDYFPIIRAARYLGVAPWDLAGLPETKGCHAWAVWANVCEAAEVYAANQAAKRR